jgi:hypothetical protein
MSDFYHQDKWLGSYKIGMEDEGEYIDHSGWWVGPATMRLSYTYDVDCPCGIYHAPDLRLFVSLGSNRLGLEIRLSFSRLELGIETYWRGKTSSFC